jgi:hypothetical protein
MAGVGRTRDELYEEAAASFRAALERLARACALDPDQRRDLALMAANRRVFRLRVASPRRENAQAVNDRFNNLTTNQPAPAGVKST